MGPTLRLTGIWILIVMVWVTTSKLTTQSSVFIGIWLVSYALGIILSRGYWLKMHKAKVRCHPEEPNDRFTYAMEVYGNTLITPILLVSALVFLVINHIAECYGRS